MDFPSFFIGLWFSDGFLEEWDDMGSTLSTLIRLAFGAMDLGSIQSMAEESPLLLVAPRPENQAMRPRNHVVKVVRKTHRKSLKRQLRSHQKSWKIS